MADSQLRFDRKQQNCVKQLSFNLKNKQKSIITWVLALLQHHQEATVIKIVSSSKDSQTTGIKIMCKERTGHVTAPGYTPRPHTLTFIINREAQRTSWIMAPET